MKTTAIILSLIFNWTLLFAQSNSIDSVKSDKELISQLKKQFSLTEYDHADIVMSFNKDTILIAGYLSSNSIGISPKNVVYRTTNGGNNWKMINFNGDAWIYCSYFEKEGKIWMGGSDEYIHFSNDYGTTWIKKPKPFTPKNRVLSIYMTDSLNGIAGGLHNGLAITNENWLTTQQIPSPLDQNKFSIIKNSSRNSIDKIEILDSIILINQNDHIYYSKLNPIIWRDFNIPVIEFSIDKTNKQWSIFSIRNKVYVLSAKLDLLKTYTKTNEYFNWGKTPNSQISLENFFSSKKITVQIKAVKYDLDRMSDGCMQFPIYKENVMVMKINDAENISKLKGILSTTSRYLKPLLQSFSFIEPDFASYEDFYSQTKKNSNEEKEWGGDFTSLINIDNDYFLNPKQIVSYLNQSLIDSVYNTFTFQPFLIERNEPYIILNVVNNKSDTLKITSENSNLFSLPWKIEYKGLSFQTFDTRITEYLRTLLPKGYNYFDKLFAGELIYRLIEQRTINELEYKNGY